MDERHSQIQCWLEKVFGGEGIPQYEINSHTIDILYDLMIRNEWQDDCINCVIEDLRQKTEEYSAEADRLGAVLEQLGITPSTLSQSGTVSLRSLARIATLLQTKNTSDTSLLLALNAATQERLHVEEARCAEQRLQAQLSNKTKAALHRLKALNQSLASLEEQATYEGPELSRKMKQAGFLQSKTREYRKQAHQLNLEVSKTGVDPSVYHHNLVTSAQELADLKARLYPLKAKLDSYYKLPPDLSLTKVKVEEAKRELAAMESELAKHIDVMHL